MKRFETRRIEPQFHTKIWGSPNTAPWFETPGHQEPDAAIGEVWFPSDRLLIKFLFTSANLSVQVHPDDHYARKHGEPHGKTEMWHILRAEPEARIALGFKRPIAADQLIPAAESGEIMHLLNWIDVHPGETYFVPAGTVHAIGAGLALCEIQQNSDVTYRLFDYGRGRELHLDASADVAHLGSHAGLSVPRRMGNGVEELVRCPYFTTWHAEVMQPGKVGPRIDTRLLVVLEGNGCVDGLPAGPGQVFEAEPHEWLVEPEASSGSMNVLMIA